jgi:hypothetical protein
MVEILTAWVAKRLTMQERIVENILESFDGIKRADPPPFFYEKIRNRLNTPKGNFLDKMDFFFARPAMTLSLTFLILALNLIVLQLDVINTSRLSENTDNSVSTTHDFELLIFGNASDNEFVYNY